MIEAKLQPKSRTIQQLQLKRISLMVIPKNTN